MEIVESNIKQKFANWPEVFHKQPIVISGPCSAETKEQVLTTAHALSSFGVKIFRAGIWKPRTRPNSFEGVGSIGLPWLQRVKQETGMLVSTEVANVKHIYEALRYGIDILWIGARTTVNPFAVQEIAEALKGVDIPVFVKNPINPDVELWMGAIERLRKSNLTKIGAIHRGFSVYGNSKYRNEPKWQIPIDLKRNMPDIPIICDPSHIGGKREMIFDISQKALDLTFDGLIIESHIDPNCALSDAKQQINPNQLNGILQNLVIRDPESSDLEIQHTLEELRTKIDYFDDLVIDVFGKRMQIADQIGELKKHNKISILQTNRWEEILMEAKAKGLEAGLSERFINKIFKAIHEESIQHQNVVMNKD
jgi:chorismate mutase